MNRDAWFIFFILCAIFGAGVSGCVALEKHRQLERAQADLAEVRHSLEEHGSRLVEAWRGAEEARARARSLEEELAGVREELRAARVDLDVARLAVTDATRSQKALEEEMRAVLESRDVDISELRGELTVSILDRILFDSGDARLKPEGMEVLDKVASVLARYTNRPVQVFGHTDNVPIRVRYGSNWELSAARAVSAVRYLTEKAGVDPRRLSAVACGEHQPIADNSTAEGRALNRRIALVVLPEAFIPTDVPSTLEEKGVRLAAAPSVPGETAVSPTSGTTVTNGVSRQTVESSTQGGNRFAGAGWKVLRADEARAAGTDPVPHGVTDSAEPNEGEAVEGSTPGDAASQSDRDVHSNDEEDPAQPKDPADQPPEEDGKAGDPTTTSGEDPAGSEDDPPEADTSDAPGETPPSPAPEPIDD